MVQRYLLQGGLIGPHDEGDWVGYEDYAALERKFDSILNLLVKLDDDLGYGKIPDEYAYDRIGEIIEKHQNDLSD
ncbi:MAG: hypothetical protein [Bacteriophage sp.]|nr:MAG: hypothetical protein [Bacteriophage sp.]